MMDPLPLSENNSQLISCKPVTSLSPKPSGRFWRFFPAGFRLVRGRGVVYLGYLLVGWLLPRLAYGLLYGRFRPYLRPVVQGGVMAGAAGLLVLASVHCEPLGVLGTAGSLLAAAAVRPLSEKWFVKRMVREARTLTAERRLGGNQALFTSWDRLPIDPQTRRAVERRQARHPGEELVLGRFDRDGRIAWSFGPIPGLPSIPAAEFIPRRRFDLNLVLIGERVLVKKAFRKDRKAFAGEWLALSRLAGRARVPALHRADERAGILYKNFIPAKTVREALVEQGAEILLAQTDGDPRLTGLPPAERLERISNRGREKVTAALSAEFLRNLEAELDRLHAGGVTGVSSTFGNVLVGPEDQAPWFIDLEGTRNHRSRGWFFQICRDRDRTEFNRRYGREILTEALARARLAEGTAKDPGWYAPVDFGGGLTTGGFWSVDSGTGRWESLNRRVIAPLVEGKRVLDLGSNNGLFPLLMLRAGAREIVGFEISPVFLDQARLVREILEWRDLRSYPLQLHQGDMRELLEKDWGSFDAVTAFCSLYYLEPGSMARVLQRVAEFAPLIIVQANDRTRPEASDRKAEKSSSRFLKKLLEDNGFSRVEVHKPRGFSRPLLVGRP
jgi:SAM-dependent methyltransferase